ncbi:MAG: hypothetical protein NC419_05720 [Muribaculaceae bacterium]|nr:hypothetical protein [Muribaculaceae bacterium]
MGETFEISSLRQYLAQMVGENVAKSVIELLGTDIGIPNAAEEEKEDYRVCAGEFAWKGIAFQIEIRMSYQEERCLIEIEQITESFDWQEWMPDGCNMLAINSAGGYVDSGAPVIGGRVRDLVVQIDSDYILGTFSMCLEGSNELLLRLFPELAETNYLDSMRWGGDGIGIFGSNAQMSLWANDKDTYCDCRAELALIGDGGEEQVGLEFEYMQICIALGVENAARIYSYIIPEEEPVPKVAQLRLDYYDSRKRLGMGREIIVQIQENGDIQAALDMADFITRITKDDFIKWFGMSPIQFIERCIDNDMENGTVDTLPIGEDPFLELLYYDLFNATDGVLEAYFPVRALVSGQSILAANYLASGFRLRIDYWVYGEVDVTYYIEFPANADLSRICQEVYVYRKRYYDIFSMAVVELVDTDGDMQINLQESYDDGGVLDECIEEYAKLILVSAGNDGEPFLNGEGSFLKDEESLLIKDFRVRGNLHTMNLDMQITVNTGKFLHLRVSSLLTLVLEELQFMIAYERSLKKIGLGARTALLIGDEKASLYAGAVYEEGLFTFRLHLLDGSLSISGLVEAVTGWNIRDYIDLMLENLDIMWRQEKDWYFRGRLGMAFTLPVLNRVKLFFDYDISSQGGAANVALHGSFYFYQFMIAAGIAFSGDTASQPPTYTFSLKFQDMTLQAAYTEDTLQFSLSDNLTIGSLISALMKLIRPNVEYRLPSPWDLLNRVSLGGITILMKMGETGNGLEKPKEIVVRKPLGINLLVARIEAITLRYYVEEAVERDELGAWSGEYREVDAAKDRFEVILETGQNAENIENTENTKNTENRRLSEEPQEYRWDLLHEQAPSPLGDKQPVVKVHSFSIARNVNLGQPRKDQTLEKVVTEIEQSLEGGAFYDVQTGWYVSAELTIADSLLAWLLFYDPEIYGFQVRFQDNLLPGMKGLDVTLYYRKVTDDIGVFYLNVTLPEAYRKLQLGAFELTIPTLEAWLYTNGNFKIDLGFPHNGDFSQSFTFGMGAWHGAGGVYFGCLNGDTSTQTPKISNGFFTPVIELGIGLMFGVGKGFRAGVLSLEAYLEVRGIFEGVFARFLPENGGESALYYRCMASVSIYGKISGEVDFKILKAGFLLEASVRAAVTLEAGEAALVVFAASLTVKAYLEILFIHLSFSFHVSYETSFTLGKKTDTPWQKVEGARTIPARLLTGCLSECLPEGEIAEGTFDWQVGTITEEPELLEAAVIPYFTVHRLPSSWSSDRGKEIQDTDYRTAFLTVMDMDTLRRLVRLLVKRSFKAAGADDTITLETLEGLIREVEDEDSPAFTLKLLDEFFQDNIHMVLTAPQEEEENGEQDSAALPLPPHLLLCWKSAEDSNADEETRDLATYYPVDDAWLEQFRRYYEKLQLLQDTQQIEQTQDIQETQNTQSFEAIIWREYIQMLTKQALSTAWEYVQELAGNFAIEESGLRMMLQTEVAIDVLLTAVDDHTDTYRAISSRFLLGGMEIPQDGEQQAIYECMGQQFPSKAPGGQAAETAHILEIRESIADPAGWISFAQAKMYQGRLLRTDEQDILKITITNAQLAYPEEAAVVFAPDGEPRQIAPEQEREGEIPLNAGQPVYAGDEEQPVGWLWKPSLPLRGLSGYSLRVQDSMDDFAWRGRKTKSNSGRFGTGVLLVFTIARTNADGVYVFSSMEEVSQSKLKELLADEIPEFGCIRLLLPSQPQQNRSDAWWYQKDTDMELSVFRSNISDTVRKNKTTLSEEEEPESLVWESTEDIEKFLRLLQICAETGGRGHFLFCGTIPVSCFGEDGYLRAGLLLVTDTETFDAADVVWLEEEYDVNNSVPVLAGGNIPPMTTASLPLGCVGFTMELIPQEEGGQAFSLMHFRTGETENFGESLRSLPLLMKEDGEYWRYEQAIPVAKLADTEEIDNPYAGILPEDYDASGEKKRLSLPITFYLSDVAGNASKESDNPLQLVTGYTDVLTSITGFPNTAAVYLIDKGDKENTCTLQIVVSCNGQRSGESAEAAGLAEKIYYQLAQADVTIEAECSLTQESFSLEKEKLLAYLQQLSQWLREKQEPPQEVVFDFPFSQPDETLRAERILPLRTLVRFARDTAYVESRNPAAATVEAVLTPKEETELFAHRLEQAIPGLKVLEQQGLYAGFFGGEGLLHLEMKMDGLADGMYALPPLARERMSRENIPVYLFDGEETQINAYDIDLEQWAAEFLAFYETLLSSETLAVLAKRQEDTQEKVRKLLEVKRRLARVISDTVQNVFGAQDTYREEARAALEDELLKNIQEGFRFCGIAAYGLELPQDMEFDGGLNREGMTITKLTGKAAVVFAYPSNPYAVSSVSMSGVAYQPMYLRDKTNDTWYRIVRPAKEEQTAVTIDLEKDEEGNEIRLPVPLREYPKQAALWTQRGILETTEGLGEIPDWSYCVDIALSAVAQDTYTLQLFRKESERTVGNSGDLFEMLASFIQSREKLYQAVTDSDKIVLLLEWFLELAEKIVAVWRTSICKEEPQQGIIFDSRFDESGFLEKIEVQTLQSAEQYPVMTCRDKNGVIYEMTAEQSPEGMVYRPAGGKTDILAGEEMIVSLEFRGLSLLQDHQMRSGISCVRNQYFEGIPIPAAEAFLYRTPRNCFPDWVKPFYRVSERLDCGIWNLENLNQAVLSYAGELDTQIYVFCLTRIADGLDSRFPVKNRIRGPVDESAVQRLYEQVENWRQEVLKTTDCDGFLVQLSAYADAQAWEPLLEVEQLYFRMGSS